MCFSWYSGRFDVEDGTDFSLIFLCDSKLYIVNGSS